MTISLWTKKSICIAFKEGGDSDWTLMISRGMNASALTFTLHWNNKEEPTHLGIIPMEAFLKELNDLIKPQTVE